MNTISKFSPLEHPHHFLERMAVSCMGKLPFESNNCLPSDKKSLSKRLEAQCMMERMLVEYLAVRRVDRAGIRALLKSNDKILRDLHKADLYPTNEALHACDLSSTYYQHIALPLLLMRLTRRATRHKEGVLFHLHNMLQTLSGDYPANIQSYMRQHLKQWQKDERLKHKSISWITKIRPSSYPSFSTCKLSFDEWKEKQTVTNTQQKAAFSQVKALYMGGLLFSALKKMLGDFKEFSFYSAQMLALENNSHPFDTYHNVMAQAVAHKDAAVFLSEYRKRVGKAAATRELIRYGDCLFMPYVLQEQFKSDLTIGKRIIRLSYLFEKSRIEDIHLMDNYFNKLDGLGYVLRALLSSVMSFERLVNWVVPKFFESSLSLVRDEIQGNELQPGTEREIIQALTRVLSEVSIRRHAGESCNTLAVFLYCFRYNEDTVQPNANAAAECIFWDTNSEPYKGQACEYILISAYNEFITRFAKPDAVRGLLCNPLLRLEQSLEVYFTSLQLGAKRAANKAFRKDRTIVRLGSKYPYQALQDLEQDVLRLALSPYLSNMPNIGAFCSLNEEEKREILAVLDKAQYEKDYLANMGAQRLM